MTFEDPREGVRRPEMEFRGDLTDVSVRLPQEGTGLRQSAVLDRHPNGLVADFPETQFDEPARFPEMGRDHLGCQVSVGVLFDEREGVPDEVRGGKRRFRGVSKGYTVGRNDDLLVLAASAHRVEAVEFLHGEESCLRVVRADARKRNRQEFRAGHVIADAEDGDLVRDLDLRRAASPQALDRPSVRRGHDGRRLGKRLQPCGKGLCVIRVGIEGGGGDAAICERAAEGAFAFAGEELPGVLVDEGEGLELALRQKVFRADPSDVSVVQPDGGHVVFARGEGGVLDVDEDGRDVGSGERLHRVRRSRHGNDDAVIRASVPPPEAPRREVLGGDEMEPPVQIVGEAAEESGHVFASGM